MDRLEQLDYYTLLGVEPHATSDEIRAAFHQFALKFHPDRHSGADAAKLARAAQIYRRGAEAYRILTSPEMRRVYDVGLGAGKLRFDPEEADRESRRPKSSTASFSVKSASARPFVSKAQAAFKQGDLQTAKLNLQIALKHEPGNVWLEAQLASVEDKLKTR